MPKHRTHKYADKLLFGKPYPQVHHAIDLPYVVYGRKHRQFYHTYKEGYCLGYIVTGEANGALAGVFHVWLDQECSKDKDFKKWLDWSAEEDAKFTRKMARQARKIRRSHAKKRRKRY